MDGRLLLGGWCQGNWSRGFERGCWREMVVMVMEEIINRAAELSGARLTAKHNKLHSNSEHKLLYEGKTFICFIKLYYPPWFVLYGILIWIQCDSNGDDKLGEKRGLSQCVISKYLQSRDIFTNVSMVMRQTQKKRGERQRKGRNITNHFKYWSSLYYGIQSFYF